MVIEMEEKNMTALISCFARCYHTENSNIKISSLKRKPQKAKRSLETK